jgi:hypothetical protein
MNEASWARIAVLQIVEIGFLSNQFEQFLYMDHELAGKEVVRYLCPPTPAATQP